MRIIKYAALPLFLLCNYSIPISAQSMANLFLRLPESCTPGLKKSDRKMLILKGEYVVTEHTEHNGRTRKTSIDYSIDTITDNYLAYECSSTKGEGSFASYEIKRFKMSNGKNILVFSKGNDSKTTSNKADLKFYSIGDTSLVESKEDFLPRKLDYSAFIKNTTPDSVRLFIKNTALCKFDLDADASDEILSYIILSSNNDQQWLIGNTMELKWTGKAFTGAVSFQTEKEESLDNPSVQAK